MCVCVCVCCVYLYFAQVTKYNFEEKKNAVFDTCMRAILICMCVCVLFLYTYTYMLCFAQGQLKGKKR